MKNAIGGLITKFRGWGGCRGPAGRVHSSSRPPALRPRHTRSQAPRRGKEEWRPRTFRGWSESMRRLQDPRRTLPGTCWTLSRACPGVTSQSTFPESNMSSAFLTAALPAALRGAGLAHGRSTCRRPRNPRNPPPPSPPLPGWAPGASSWITASLNTLSGYLGGGNGVFPRLPSLEDPSSAEGRVGRHHSRSQPARLFVRSAWRLGPCRLTTDECPSLGRRGRRENVSARPTTSVATL